MCIRDSNITVLDSYFNLTNISNLIYLINWLIDLIRVFDYLVVAYFFGPPVCAIIHGCDELGRHEGFHLEKKSENAVVERGSTPLSPIWVRHCSDYRCAGMAQHALSLPSPFPSICLIPIPVGFPCGLFPFPYSQRYSFEQIKLPVFVLFPFPWDSHVGYSHSHTVNATVLSK